MHKYILTVDTGGSKTCITAFDKNDSIISRIWSPGVGVVGKADLSQLEAALRDLGDIISFDEVGQVVINLGGTNTAQLKAEFEKYFKNARVDAFRESSGVIMNSICEMEKCDALLMAGTGVICFSKGKNGKMITDAWGPNTGDKGSGYWIGLEAVSRSLMELEEGEPLSPLAKYITGREEPFAAVADSVELMELRDLTRKNFMPPDRKKIAGFAKISADYAREGDEAALGIFREAGELMAKTVLRGVTRAGCTENPCLFISGGLIHSFDLWGEAFKNELNKKIRFTFKTGEADMTQGMLYYSKNR